MTEKNRIEQTWNKCINNITQLFSKDIFKQKDVKILIKEAFVNYYPWTYAIYAKNMLNVFRNENFDIELKCVCIYSGLCRVYPDESLEILKFFLYRFNESLNNSDSRELSIITRFIATCYRFETISNYVIYEILLKLLKYREFCQVIMDILFRCAPLLEAHGSVEIDDDSINLSSIVTDINNKWRYSAHSDLLEKFSLWKSQKYSLDGRSYNQKGKYDIFDEPNILEGITLSLTPNNDNIDRFTHLYIPEDNERIFNEWDAEIREVLESFEDDDDDDKVNELNTQNDNLPDKRDEVTDMKASVDETEMAIKEKRSNDRKIEYTRQAYLITISSGSANEIAHKLIKYSQENEPELIPHLISFLVDYVKHSDTYNRSTSICIEKILSSKKEWIKYMIDEFYKVYDTVTSLSETQMRNLAETFAFLLCSNVLPWSIFEKISFPFESNMASHRVFIRNLMTSLQYCPVKPDVSKIKTSDLGSDSEVWLAKWFSQEHIEKYMSGIFNMESKEKADIVIFFFENIGMGYLVNKLREKTQTFNKYEVNSNKNNLIDTDTRHHSYNTSTSESSSGDDEILRRRIKRRKKVKSRSSSHSDDNEDRKTSRKKTKSRKGHKIYSSDQSEASHDDSYDSEVRVKKKRNTKTHNLYQSMDSDSTKRYKREPISKSEFVNTKYDKYHNESKKMSNKHTTFNDTERSQQKSGRKEIHDDKSDSGSSHKNSKYVYSADTEQNNVKKIQNVSPIDIVKLRNSLKRMQNKKLEEKAMEKASKKKSESEGEYDYYSTYEYIYESETDSYDDITLYKEQCKQLSKQVKKLKKKITMLEKKHSKLSPKSKEKYSTAKRVTSHNNKKLSSPSSKQSKRHSKSGRSNS